MHDSLNLYIPNASCLHRLDARVKLVLLLAFSISAFLIHSWTALGVLASVVILALFIARLPFLKLIKLSVPLLAVLAFVWVCNAFVLDVHKATTSSLSGVSVGFAADLPTITLIGSFGFSPQGCMYALFYTGRILLILFASFLTTFTTTSSEISNAFAALLRPLQAIKVPVDDIALTLSVALCYIGIVGDEMNRIRVAQIARSAPLDNSSLWRRLHAWQAVFVPLIVSLFRRADTLSAAMEARCYGAGKRSYLHTAELNVSSLAVLVGGLALCLALVLR